MLSTRKQFCRKSRILRRRPMEADVDWREVPRSRSMGSRVMLSVKVSMGVLGISSHGTVVHSGRERNVVWQDPKACQSWKMISLLVTVI